MAGTQGSFAQSLQPILLKIAVVCFLRNLGNPGVKAMSKMITTLVLQGLGYFTNLANLILCDSYHDLGCPTTTLCVILKYTRMDTVLHKSLSTIDSICCSVVTQHVERIGGLLQNCVISVSDLLEIP